ncbi:MAG: hypothetical protein LIO43_01140, partial [Clostridiales bacterium]|nr:hypothetical protein [Clostridiales bacterium]
WYGVNVKYNKESNGYIVEVENTIFYFDDNPDIADEQQSDIIYCVNENGYYCWGANEWLK